MALKYEVEKLDDVDESMRELYEEKGGKFVLKVEGVPAPDNDLAERLRKLEANNQSLLEEKRKAKEAADKAQLEAARKAGDLEAVEKSWKDKLKALEEERAQERANLESVVQKMTADQSASQLAAEVFGQHAKIALPHIRSRLKTEVHEGTATIRVLDAEGKPTAMSLDDLREEFRNNPDYASIVVGSRAKGSGSPPNSGAGGNVPAPGGLHRHKMTAKQKAEYQEKYGQEAYLQLPK